MASPRQRAVSALAVIANTVYADGDFTSSSGAPRTDLAAIDARGGALSAWNPATDGEVSALLATPPGLVAAGRFYSVSGTSQRTLAIFPPTAEPPAFASDQSLR